MLACGWVKFTGEDKRARLGVKHLLRAAAINKQLLVWLLGQQSPSLCIQCTSTATSSTKIDERRVSNGTLHRAKICKQHEAATSTLARRDERCGIDRGKCFTVARFVLSGAMLCGGVYRLTAYFVFHSVIVTEEMATSVVRAKYGRRMTRATVTQKKVCWQMTRQLAQKIPICLYKAVVQQSLPARSLSNVPMNRIARPSLSRPRI